MATLADYLDISVVEARRHFDEMQRRVMPPPGGRQVTFTPTETLLCLAASFVHDYSRFGSGTAHRAPEPVQLLGRLFKRPPTSIISKIANLDGSRPHGARWDLSVGTILTRDTHHFSEIYRVIFAAARAAGVGTDQLPDFLYLESGGEFELLSQDELDPSVLESEIERRLREQVATARRVLTEEQTTYMVVTAARIGQHRFAKQVLHNCGRRCVFCGFAPSALGAQRMLIASHIKPWRDSTPRERLDHRNGLAACPTHDVAFDTGLLTVNGGLRIQVSPKVLRAAGSVPGVNQYFSQPPLRQRILLPSDATLPEPMYLSWHRERIFIVSEDPAR